MENITIEKDCVVIGCGLTREHVCAVRNELLEAFQTAAPRRVSLENVQAIDAAGLQLLAAITKSWPGVGFVNTPEVVLATLRRVSALSIVEGSRERS